MATTRGIERTLRLLTRTANPAAIEVLDAGLRSDEPVMREAAARALSRRRGSASVHTLLLALAETPPDVQRAVSTPDAALRLRPGVLSAIKGDDLHLCKRAARYAHDAGDAYVLPTLAEQSSRPDHPYGLGLATTALHLAKLLSERIYTPDQVAPDGPVQDPAFPRRAALNALIRAVDLFGKHGHLELVEAFLLLVVPDDLVLRRVLTDPTHAAHQPMLESLANSTAPGAMHVVCAALLQEHPPAPLIGVLTSRTDRAFVEYLLTDLGEQPPLRALESARGLAGFAWGEPQHQPTLMQLTGPQQATALKLLAATSMSKRRLSALCEAMLESGKVEGRVSACHVIGGLNSRVASSLISRALTDPENAVVAAATTQLRNRGIDGSTEKLISLLDHQHESVQKAAQGAAQSSLPEHNYRAFCERFDLLEEPARQVQGRLVGKADPKCAAAVRRDLSTASPKQRLRTLEVAGALGIGDQLSEALLEHISDDDPAIRAAAARALGGAKNEAARKALTAALKDKNSTVREAADQALGPLPPIDLASGLVSDMQQEFPL
ncbi:HEAT repeat protein [Posidoniimonas polymericola]|uniref:HEAT repeat protein n=1 Tax=Posidoniimonas polymericola TaxID=2528002 RepID=A0A5C5YMK3_9BACT|nr:HEAT repeat domain-containing protein [Posidoniimonas polymericola]TWT75998.1 HEAT repeat protein [Posidoniimonas polymericola]